VHGTVADQAAGDVRQEALLLAVRLSRPIESREPRDERVGRSMTGGECRYCRLARA
jgi:hypothetical protein